MAKLITLDDAKKVTDIRQGWTMAQTRWASFREHQVRNFNYVAGRMIDPDVLKQLNADGRPVFQFLLAEPYLRFMAGKIRRDGTRMKATPINSDDVEGAGLRSKLVGDWMVGKNGYEQIAVATMYAACGSLGFVNEHMNYADEPEGRWMVEALDPFCVLFDPDAQKYDQSDWRWLAYSKMYSVEEIIAIHAEYMDEDTKELLRDAARRYEGDTLEALGKPRGWADRVARTINNFLKMGSTGSGSDGLLTDFLDAANGLYRCIEWHDRRYEPYKAVYSPVTRKTEDIPAEHHDNAEYIKAALERHPMGTIVTDQKQVLYVSSCVPALLPDKLLFEQPYKVQGHGFRIKPIWCYNFHPDVTEMGNMMNPLIAPIDFFNQRQMSMMELFLDSVNGPIEAPEGSIDDTQLPAWQSKKRNIIRKFKPMLNNLKPERVKPADGAFQMADHMGNMGLELMERLGFNPNQMGVDQTSNENASLFQKRVSAGEVMLAHFFDNVAAAQREIFNYASAAVPHYLTFPRELRILNDKNDAEFLPINWPTLNGILNDVSDGEYDFVADTQSIGETARQENLILLMQVVKIVPPEYIPWDEVFRAMDFPTAEKIADYVKKQMALLEQQKADNVQAGEAAKKLQLMQAAMSVRDQHLAGGPGTPGTMPQRTGAAA